MRLPKRSFSVAFVMSVVLIVAACAHGSIDDGDSADVMLTVKNLPNIPPVTAAPAADGVTCVYTVSNVSVTLGSRPKSQLAVGSPFSDISMDNVEIAYEWIGVTGVAADTFPIAGTIPVDGTQTVTFAPIRLDYLTGMAGHSAGLTMVFHGHTLDGHGVSATGGGTLTINSCTTTAVCGDGAINGAETCDDQNINSGDGCSAACQVESGYACAGQPSVCQIINIP